MSASATAQYEGQESQKKRKWGGQRQNKGFLRLIFPTLGHLD